MTTSDLSDAMAGCLLGGAIGDAVGLCCEGLTPRRQAALFPGLDGPRLVGRLGMVSDDTDHARMTAQALAEAGNDADLFAARLAIHLRRWLLCLPAGVGMATLRAGVRLIAGHGPRSSGVFSAGNGPAMRAPILGVACGDDVASLREFVRASTRLTHTDPKAEWGALAVAVAASMACRAGGDVSPAGFLASLAALLPPEASELMDLLNAAGESATSDEPTQSFADGIGLRGGVTGYMYHTVPVVVQTWLRHQTDLETGILEIVRCGGDTDTTAAILGGIIGARVGRGGVPEDWVRRIYDTAYPADRLDRLAEYLANVRCTGQPRRLSSPGIAAMAARNTLFLAAVLGHSLRRLLPPY